VATIHAELATKLAALAGHSRVYYHRLKQSPTYPAISFWRVTGGVVPLLQGGPALMQRADMQIDVWAQTYDDAQSTAETLRLGLDGYAGLLGSFRVSIEGWASRDQYHDDAQPPAVHQVICTCTVWFGEP
jgi:hypothetical protein